MTAIALTIAGSDSGGGAGIQADLKTMSACGVYATSVITALTAQNTIGVTAIHDVPSNFIEAQMDAVFSDIDVDAVKIGMLSQPDIIQSVTASLKKHNPPLIVLDPVMVAESGDALLAEEAVSALIDHLFPLATLITPNLHEAAKLLGAQTATTQEQMEQQAKTILDLGTQAVLLKGGHSAGADAADFYVDADGTSKWFSAPFIDTKNTHGTGCSLSSSITSYLAHGDDLLTAIHKAKTWLSAAIRNADNLDIGNGAGPVHHFHQFWKVPHDET